MQQDTIAAIATGMTQAGIGIIRISGEAAIAVAERMYRGCSGQRAAEYESHTIHLGYIYEEETAVDQVLLTVYRAPKSYTGEDTVEINCHGGMYLCRRILEIALRSGARLAEPGEFTKRAFLNGRLDLSQAEAVMDLISSKNAYAARNSIEQLSGSVRDKVVSLRERILHEIAYIEAALDDPEHYDLTDYPEELAKKVDALLEEIERMLVAAQNGRLRREGIRTVILGKPNVGKSSILNMLSGHESAIVTEIAGTTRDMVEETVRLGELQLALVDTAGIRKTTDEIERIGVERARETAAGADLILFIVDASQPLEEADREIMPLLLGRRAVLIRNKSDLPSVTDRDTLRRVFEKALIESVDEAMRLPAYPIIELSTKTQQGMEDLQASLEQMFLDSAVPLNDEVVITNLRQLEELRLVRRSLHHVLTAIETFMTEDFFSIDLTDAYRHLGYIIGEELADDVADRIFSEFCVGK